MNGLQHKILVLGLGRSGMAAAQLLRKEGHGVVVLERSRRELVDEQAQFLEGIGAEVLSSDPDVPDAPWDLAVVSPGVPLESPWIRTLQERGIPLCSEIELGWSRFRGSTLAVSGSNGKSTAVKWLGNVLEAAGCKVAVGGNCTPSACELALEKQDADIWVLEVSSFQLETVRDFRPDVGLLLNVQPNHLDRHGDMGTYTRLKFRLFDRFGIKQTAVVPFSEAARLRELTGGASSRLTFGVEDGADFRWDKGWVHDPGGGSIDFRGTYFDNPVLGPACAAITAAVTAIHSGAQQYLSPTAAGFVPLPHRMEEVGFLNGVRFVDDSKATSLPALEAALRMTPGGIRLIAGGRAKDSVFHTLLPLVKERVHSAYLIGEDAALLHKAWSGAVPCRMSGTLEQAVLAAWREALSGETILLAPGCASFDQFPGFGERGDCFKNCYYMLANSERMCKENRDNEQE